MKVTSSGGRCLGSEIGDCSFKEAFVTMKAEKMEDRT